MPRALRRIWSTCLEFEPCVYTQVIHNLSELEARVRRWEAVLFGSGQDIAPPRAPTRPACVAKSPTSVLVSWARDHHDNGLPVKVCPLVWDRALIFSLRQGKSTQF